VYETLLKPTQWTSVQTRSDLFFTVSLSDIEAEKCRETDTEQNLHEILLRRQETNKIKHVLNPIWFIRCDISMQELYANLNALEGY
jgi:hypothetical protein